MKPSTASSNQSAAAFMEELLSELQPPVLPLSEPAARASRPPCTARTTKPSLSKTSTAEKCATRVLAPRTAVKTPSVNVGGNGSAPRDAQLPDDPSCGLFEGIEDWGDFELEDRSPPPPPATTTCLREEPTPLCQAFVKCRVETVGEAQWNPLKKCMERQLEVVLEREKQSSSPRKTLLLCDEWTDLALERDNSLNLVSLPGSPAINLQLDPLVFSRSEPGHVVVLFPSLLVSASVVANAPMCSRRSLLSTRLKLSSNQVGEPVVRGNIVHETIQNLLLPHNKHFQDSVIDSPRPNTHHAWQKSHVLQEARRACVRRLDDLFMIGKNVEEGMKMVADHLEQIPMWAHKYLIIDGNQNADVVLNKDAVLVDPRTRVKAECDQPRIGITGILDTEEEIWSPKYGLKGKIDASVQALVHEHPASSKSKISNLFEDRATPLVFPLEIKTGVQPSGIEHIAQTMLYTLLMSDRYNVHVDSGLLYYTSRDDLIRVRAVKDELRHLIMARNQLAYYLQPQAYGVPQSATLPPPLPGCIPIPDVEELTPLESCSGRRPLLPEPIDREFACCKCFEVDGCMLYRKAVEGVDTLPPQKGIERLRELYQRKTHHLTTRQTDFFRSWEALISYEESELGRSKKQIWNMSAAEREQAGDAFANMVIDYSFDARRGPWNLASPMKMHRYVYRLQRRRDTPSDTPGKEEASLLLGHMSKNDPVVVSIDGKKLAVARGFILDLGAQQMVVGLDHRLEELDALPLGTNLANHLSQYASTQPSPPATCYRVDKDELMAGMGRIRDNLAQLFLENGNSNLRELVVDLKKPRFDPSASGCATWSGESSKGLPSDSLNEEQGRVLAKVLSAKDYALVLGMPGTGKTTTIAELIKTLIKRGKKVLLTSYTHSAVDNILSKLIDSNIDMLRLGNVDKVATALHRFTIDEGDPPESVEQLETRLMAPPLVATTSLSINHPIFSRRWFDYCIVDEASQITLPTCLGPLRYASVFVLVGDHYQLPPLVKNPRAKAGGLETSLFKLLTEAHPDAVASLTTQYRMNDDIMSLSNALIYDGRLRSGGSKTSTQRLEVPRLAHQGSSAPYYDDWLTDLMQPERRVLFANTDSLGQGGEESRAGRRVQNEVEARLVLQLVNALVQGGVAVSDIGVITPFRQQLKLLTTLCAGHPELEMMTADRAQGRDKACIVMTWVRSNQQGEVGELLRDWRRINVCLTRAKKKLVMFGSLDTLRGSPVLGEMLKLVGDMGWIYPLPPNAGLPGPPPPKILPATRNPPPSPVDTPQPTSVSISTSISSQFKRPADHLSPKRILHKKINLYDAPP